MSLVDFRIAISRIAGYALETTPKAVIRGVGGAAMEFRILGPLEVLGEDGPLPLEGAKQRAVLALLVLNANQVVSRERLVDALWGDGPPETAVTTIQVYVSRLRKLLPAGAIATRGAGYVLEAEPETVDLQRFERLVGAARAVEPRRAAQLLRGGGP